MWKYSGFLVGRFGEKTFIDFSGQTVDIINSTNGVITKAELFIAVLPASGFAFVEAIGSQKKRDFIDAHADMFAYFGGVIELLVPDNLKSAVTRADNYDLDVNPARHYSSAVMP